MVGLYYNRLCAWPQLQADVKTWLVNVLKDGKPHSRAEIGRRLHAERPGFSLGYILTAIASESRFVETRAGDDYWVHDLQAHR